MRICLLVALAGLVLFSIVKLSRLSYQQGYKNGYTDGYEEGDKDGYRKALHRPAEPPWDDLGVTNDAGMLAVPAEPIVVGSKYGSGNVYALSSSGVWVMRCWDCLTWQVQGEPRCDCPGTLSWHDAMDAGSDEVPNAMVSVVDDRNKAHDCLFVFPGIDMTDDPDRPGIYMEKEE